MSEFDPDATQQVKTAVVGWLRKNLTLKVLIVILLGAIKVGWMAVQEVRDLRMDVNGIKEEFKVSKAQGEDIAALKARVVLLEKIDEERRAWVDRTYAELPPSRRRSR